MSDRTPGRGEGRVDGKKTDRLSIVGGSAVAAPRSSRSPSGGIVQGRTLPDKTSQTSLGGQPDMAFENNRWLERQESSPLAYGHPSSEASLRRFIKANNQLTSRYQEQCFKYVKEILTERRKQLAR